MQDWIELFNGRDLTGWSARGDHDWRVVGNVSLDLLDRKKLAVEEGNGVLLNGPTGRTLDLHTIASHGSCELLLEFNLPAGSNSGVYLMGQYEIQLLDSWEVPKSEMTFSSCGGIYARWVAETRTAYDGHAPQTNATRPPGEWQTLRVLFHAPPLGADGQPSGGARFELVELNGATIHENVQCSGPTRGAWSEVEIAAGPLRLQGDHGPVAFRHLRMRPL